MLLITFEHGRMTSNPIGGAPKFVIAMTSPKKKKRSPPVSLHLFHHFWPKYATKRVSQLVLTFFFFFFGDAVAVTNFSAKM